VAVGWSGCVDKGQLSLPSALAAVLQQYQDYFVRFSHRRSEQESSKVGWGRPRLTTTDGYIMMLSGDLLVWFGASECCATWDVAVTAGLQGPWAPSVDFFVCPRVSVPRRLWCW
jgi:hypothetical protein